MHRQERVRKVVSLVDTAPTILDLMGIPAPANYQGRTMLDGAPRMALFFADYSLGLLGLRDGPWKFVYEIGLGQGKTVRSGAGSAGAIRRVGARGSTGVVVRPDSARLVQLRRRAISLKARSGEGNAVLIPGHAQNRPHGRLSNLGLPVTSVAVEIARFPAINAAVLIAAPCYLLESRCAGKDRSQIWLYNPRVHLTDCQRALEITLTTLSLEGKKMHAAFDFFLQLT